MCRARSFVPQNMMNPHLYLFDKTEYARSIRPTYSQVFGKNSNLSNLVPTFFHSYKNSKYGYLHLLYVIACNHFFIYLHEELKCLARLLDYFHIDGSSKEYHCTKKWSFPLRISSFFVQCALSGKFCSSHFWNGRLSSFSEDEEWRVATFEGPLGWSHRKVSIIWSNE